MLAGARWAHGSNVGHAAGRQQIPGWGWGRLGKGRAQEVPASSSKQRASSSKRGLTYCRTPDSAPHRTTARPACTGLACPAASRAALPPPLNRWTEKDTTGCPPLWRTNKQHGGNHKRSRRTDASVALCGCGVWAAGESFVWLVSSPSRSLTACDVRCRVSRIAWPF